jgi:hypothetical protein
MFMVFGLVMHVTILAIVGYALLFSASKAEGLIALIGRLLGLWVFLLAILSIVAGVAFHMSGGKLLGMDWSRGHGMHEWGPHPWGQHPGGPMMGPAANQAPPAKP